MRPNVATPSAEADAMADGLEMVRDVTDGLTAMRAKAGKYLPRYAAEQPDEWRRRVNAAPWRPEFNDVLETLASKPFTRPISFPEDAPDPILRFAENVTNTGENVTTFARRLFRSVLRDGVSLLLVDMPRAPKVRNVAEEKALGIRPYWAQYDAASIIALRTNVIAGRREIVHVRLRESVVEPDGWGEKTIEQVRVIEPGAWSIWRRSIQKPDEWVEWRSGEMFTNPAGGVPATLMFTAPREGELLCKPPLVDIAHLQIELWRALSRQEEILTFSGSPMLCATGLDPAMHSSDDTIAVGPKRVLTAGEHGSWSYLQPDAAVLREVRESVQAVVADIQRLGLQPQIARPGPVTATEVSLSSAKARSALESWALALQDCLTTALAMTIPLLGYEDKKAVGDWNPSLNVFSDFADLTRTDEARVIVDAARAGLISAEIARAEMFRRGILGPAVTAESSPAPMDVGVVEVVR